MKTTGGNGGYDSVLSIGVTLDAEGLQKQWDRAFKGLQTPAVVSDKATNAGKKMLENLLPKNAVAAVNTQITELTKRIDQFNDHLSRAGEKRTKNDRADLKAFMKPFEALTANLGTEEEKLKRIGGLLNSDMKGLEAVVKSITSLTVNAPRGAKLLDLFSSLPDEAKLQKNASTIRRVQEQVSQQQALLADLRRLHAAARASGNTQLATVIGGQIGLQTAALKKYTSGTDLIAAQKRVDDKFLTDRKNAEKDLNKQRQEELAALEKHNAKMLEQQAKAEALRRKLTTGREAFTRLQQPSNLPADSRLNATNTGAYTKDLKDAVTYLREMERRYNAIAQQRQIEGKDNKAAVDHMKVARDAAIQYEKEQERIGLAVKANSLALRAQMRLGIEMARDIDRAAAKQIADKQKLSEMDRAALFAQIQRDRKRDAEFARIRRVNPMDSIEKAALQRVSSGTSTLPLDRQNELVNRAIKLQQALVIQYDKIIKADEVLGKNTDALNRVRDTEAGKLKTLTDRNLQLAEAIKQKNEADKKSKSSFEAAQRFYQRRFDDQQKRELRSPDLKLASDSRLASRAQGNQATITGTTDQLKLQNAELEKALEWHKKSADALARELSEAQKLKISHTAIEAELSKEVVEIAKIEQEHQAVNAAMKAQIKLEEQSLRNQTAQQEKLARIKTDLAARVKGGIAGNREGDALVRAGGGYGAFNAKGLNVEQAKLATEALRKMASELQTAYTKQEQLGKGSAKLAEYLGKVSTSARQAEAAVAKLQREAARAHGISRLGEEMASTVKNFAKFALIYQGLYGILGFFRGLTGAVVDLNKELANMQAITATSTEEMKGISRAILDVASNSRFSVGEVTEAAKVIAQAGASAEELPKILQSVADFSAGTDTALATSADIITSVREVYKNLTEAQVANQLTKAVNISKLSGEDLKTIMSIGAQVAEGFNVTSEQMLAAASTLRNAGVKASTISTGLRQALLEVFNPQDNTVKALQKQYAKLGQNLSEEVIKARFYNFSKEADPLMAVLRELKTLGFGGEGDFTLGRAFDVRALNVLKEMVKSTDEYLALQREITFGQPAAEAAATSMESLSSSWTKFKNVWTASLFDGSGPLLKGLQEVLDKLSEILEKRRQLANEEKAKGEYGKESIRSGLLSNPAFYGGVGLVGLGGAALLTPFAGFSPYLMTAGGAAIAGAAGNEVYKKKFSPPSSQSRLEGSQAVAATSQAELDKAQAAYDAYRTDIADSGVGKELTDAVNLASKINTAITDTLGASALNSEEVAAILKELQGTATVNRRQELLGKLKELSSDSSKVTFDSVNSLVTLMEEASGSSKAMVDNYASLFKVMRNTAANGTGQAQETAKNTLEALRGVKNSEGKSASLELLAGHGTPEQNRENYKLLLDATAKVAYEAGDGVQALQKKVILDNQEVFRLAIEDVQNLPLSERDAALQEIITGQLADISMMARTGSLELVQEAIQRSANTIAPYFGDKGFFAGIKVDQKAIADQFGIPLGAGGKVEVPRGMPGNPYKAPVPSSFQKIADEAATKKAEEEAIKAAQYKADHAKVDPELSKQSYSANPEASARANSLDFEITKLQKFGDAAGAAGDLIRQKNAILAGELNNEIKVLQHNKEVAKQDSTESDAYKKASADLADKQLELEKLKLQADEEYLDNMQKSATREMDMFQQQKDSILAASGSFDGLAELNTKYTATQQALIENMKEYMRTSLHMSEEEIKRYIESNPSLQKGLLQEKDYNTLNKRFSAEQKAAEALIPKSATTGNALMDAKARAGLGFTNAEEAKFAASKYSGVQNQIAVLQRQNSQATEAAAAADTATAERINADIEARTAAIHDLGLELDDLNNQIQEFSSTAAGELASVFNADGVRFFTHALETSGNALKDWGDNIRNSLVTAWDSVGDAIAGAVLDGEDFVDSMKKITRDLAREVFTMTTKNMMNNVLLGGLTGTYGGAVPAATGATTPGQPPVTPAAPAGILSKVASAIGITPSTVAGGGASSVGTMTVNAGVVNVNGGTGSALAASAKDSAMGIFHKPGELVGPPAPEKSLFQTVEDKISTGMDSVMGSLEKAFKSLDSGLGGLLSGIGNMASSLWNGAGDLASSAGSAIASWAGKAVSAMGFSTGAIIPMKYAGGYVSRSGVIKGPGTGTSDSINGSMFTKSGRYPIRVSSGESILTAKATSMLGENTIRSLNSGIAKKFATGGMVAQSRSNADAANLKTQSPSVTVSPAAPQNIQMINTIDSDSVVQAGLSSPASVKTLINVVKANKSAFKTVLT